MPGIERKDFPEITFTEALEILATIRSKNIKTVEALGGELGYSAKSHGGLFFYKRMALSKHYGLLEASQSTVILTRLGERIASPLNDSDRASAMREAVNSVPLVKRLYEALGSSYHPDDFKPKLSELTGAGPAEVAAAAKRIEPVYQDAVLYLGSGPARGQPRREEERSPGRRNGSAEGARDREEPQVPGFDRPVRTFHHANHYFVSVALDPEAIEEAIALLTAFKAHVEGRKRGTGTPPEVDREQPSS